MFGDKITLLDAGVITLFSMVVVFISLLVISYIIDLMRVIFNKKDKKTVENKTIQQSPQPVVNTVVEEDDTELVAVITAAIAAMTGTNTSGLVVRNIKRLPDSDTTWSKTGKIELMR